MDLIDWTSDSGNRHRYIFTYQDHLTKYVILRPLKTKNAEEVFFNLIDIFCLFGAPNILQVFKYCSNESVNPRGDGVSSQLPFVEGGGEWVYPPTPSNFRTNRRSEERGAAIESCQRGCSNAILKFS